MVRIPRGNLFQRLSEQKLSQVAVALARRRAYWQLPRHLTLSPRAVVRLMTRHLVTTKRHNYLLLEDFLESPPFSASKAEL